MANSTGDCYTLRYSKVLFLQFCCQSSNFQYFMINSIKFLGSLASWVSSEHDPIMSKVLSNGNYCVMQILWPQNGAWCLHLVAFPNVFYLHHHLDCKAITSAEYGQYFQGRILLRRLKSWLDQKCPETDVITTLHLFRADVTAAFHKTECTIIHRNPLDHEIKIISPGFGCVLDISYVSYLCSFHSPWKANLTSRHLLLLSDDELIRWIGVSYRNTSVSPWPAVGNSV